MQGVTIFDHVAWPETMAGNMNQLSRPDRQEILSKLALLPEGDVSYQPFGDGHAAEKIVSIAARYLSEKGERR